MSTATVDEYHPGLEGVIANETAISNVEGKQGAGGLEYRGYQIEDLASGVSYLEAAYLLAPRRPPQASSTLGSASRPGFKASAALCPRRLVIGLLGQIPAGQSPDGRAPNVGQRDGSL